MAIAKGIHTDNMTQPFTLKPPFKIPFKLPSSEMPDFLQSEQLLPSFTAGTVTGIIGVIRAISYAALIFAGPLSAHLGLGIGMAIFSTAVIAIVAALTSSFGGTIATPLAAPTAVLAVMAAELAAALPASTPPMDVFLTVLTAIAIGSLFTGSLLLFLGKCRLGSVLQVVPYPVVGGFMAGTGWLLVRGAIQVATDSDLTWQTLNFVFQMSVLWHWLPGLGLGILLYLVTRRYKHYLVMPGMLLGSAVIFYLVLWCLNFPVEAARSQGWLLGPFPAGGLWHPLQWEDFTHIHWQAIAGQAGNLITLALVTLLSLLLTKNGIELIVERHLDLNRELESVGLSNLASGLGSGMAGNQALPSTLLAHKIGASNRLTGIINGITCLAVLMVGAQFLAYLPKPVIGGLLFYLALTLLVQWIYQSWSTLERVDYFTVVAIGVLTNAVGFLEGILAGFAMALVAFAIRYSQIDVVAQITSAASYPSHLTRTPQNRQWLQVQGEKVGIVQLQGFVFFATASQFLDQVRDRLLDPQQPSLQFLILDLQQVQGVDSSAALNFQKIRQMAINKQIELVFTGLNKSVEDKLVAQGVFQDSKTSPPRIFEDLGQGLAWCENQLLQEKGKQASMTSLNGSQPKVISA